MVWRRYLIEATSYLRTLWNRSKSWYWSLSLKKQQLLLTIGLVVVTSGTFYSVFIKAPRSFPEHEVITIESGFGLSHTTELLRENNLIRSEIIFKALVVLLGNEHDTQAGDYFFSHPQNSLTIARRIAKGEYGLEPIKTTIFEGSNIFEIAQLFTEKGFDKFDPDEFVKLAVDKNLEGYLFPDTYFFLPNANAKDVLLRLNDHYNEQVKTVADELGDSTYDFEEIMIVASIVEKEAHTTEDRRKIADVVWRRLEIGMPLQVDVTFSYINGKNSYTLTKDDLKTDSPYNTYVYKGLPPTPIANPSLDSILAAANPEPTDYLYFLADMSGNVYFAEDFEGHQYNRERYLRQ